MAQISSCINTFGELAQNTTSDDGEGDDNDDSGSGTDSEEPEALGETGHVSLMEFEENLCEITEIGTLHGPNALLFLRKVSSCFRNFS